MLPINASNGCGLVDDAELYEAVGACILSHSGYPVLESRLVDMGSTKWEHNWEFTYKGRVYRVAVIYGMTPAARDPVPVRWHFDYHRQSEASDT